MTKTEILNIANEPSKHIHIVKIDGKDSIVYSSKFVELLELIPTMLTNADVVAMLKEIREEIDHCSSRYNLAREQGCQGQVVWSEYLYKQGDVLAILGKKISELEENGKSE